MDLPVQISFRHVPFMDDIADDIRARATRLRVYAPRLLNCRVVVEQAHHRHERGNRYHVRIELAVPGDLIVIAREPDTHGAVRQAGEESASKAAEASSAHKSLAEAVHDAFEDARRRLQDYVRRRREPVETSR